MLEFMRERLLPSLIGYYDSETRVRRRLVKKYVRSLPQLKVYIGSVNFVEKDTPFAMLNFCFDQIVSLLLIR